MPYRVLAVCTGNICRSPAVELQLARVLDASVTVASAGTGAMVGHPVSASMAKLLADDGYDVGGFAARQLTPEIVSGSDLILTATPAHRAWVVDRVPGAVRRTLGVVELARLVSTIEPAALATLPPGDDDGRLPALVDLALRERPKHAGRSHADELPDPYGLGDEAYATSYAQVSAAVAGIEAALRGGAGSPGRQAPR